MIQISYRAMLTLALICIQTALGGAEERSSASEKSIADVLLHFEQGDPGWTARMKSLVHVVRAGPTAVPVLIESLGTGNVPEREFAAHALSIIADPRSEPALTKALEDPDRSVRIYAVRALSALGKLKLTDEYIASMRAASDNWKKAPWMPGYLKQAEHSNHPPNPNAKQRALLGFDLAKMDTARLGHMAPDFVLMDRQGKKHRLSDFRGKKTVLLEFNVGGG